MRTIAITGSASGIGRATVERLRARGDRVIGVDVRDSEILADLSTDDGRTAAVEGVIHASQGTLDGLVTCAGLAGLPGRAGSLLVSVNYFGTIALLEGLRPLLAAAGGAAVAISSNSTTIQPNWPTDIAAACLDGDEPLARKRADVTDSMSTYPATKWAIAHYVRRRSADWASGGVTLNAVAPGLVETPLVAEGRKDPTVAPMLAGLPIPVGRGGHPDEIAAFLEFLLSPDARFFSGSVLFLDGGTDALLRPDDWPARWQAGKF